MEKGRNAYALRLQTKEKAEENMATNRIGLCDKSGKPTGDKIEITEYQARRIQERAKDLATVRFQSKTEILDFVDNGIRPAFAQELPRPRA